MLQVRRFRPSQVVSRVLVVLALLTATHVASAASITDNRYSDGQNDKYRVTVTEYKWMYNPATGQYECMAVYVGVYPYSYVGQLPYYNPPVYHFSVTVTGLTPCTLHGFHVERQPGGQGNWLTEQYYQCSTGQN